MTRYTQYATCPRCVARVAAGEDIEPAEARRHIWGHNGGQWEPPAMDDASETDWKCDDCHDDHRAAPFTPAEIAQLDATASDYEEDPADE